MRLTDLLERLEYEVVQGSEKAEVTELTNDSRKVVPGSVFVCISGAVSDGHAYVKEVAEKGAKAVIVEKQVEAPDGVTVIHNAAKEPEISQLCHFLNGMGAVICGMETEHLMVQGVKRLHDSVWKIEGDRIVAGTYSTAVMAAGGNISLKEVNTKQLKLPLELLRKAGANVREEEFSLHISMKDRPKALSVCTGPYPEFPTDLQSPFMAFLACAKGESRIREQVFEDRFGTAAALRKMGADITCKGKDAWVRGVYPLKGARVKALDLRGGAALAVAALGAEGKTVIEDCSHIVRGYEDICRDINALGGKISWMESDTG